MFEVEKNAHYREDREDAAAPFHADEQIRLGRTVHLVGYNYGRCLSARIAGHVGSKPDEVSGYVYLAIDYPPRTNVEDNANSYRMWRPEPGAQRPMPGTWHWPRACPDGL